MEDHELEKAICKSLSLESLWADFHRTQDKDGNITGSFWQDGIDVHSLWIATVKRYFYGYVTIGVAKYSPERKPIWEKKEIPILYKGVVLVDDFKGSFVGGNPLRSVELPDFNDPVSESLQQLNLIPRITEIPPDGDGEDLNLRVWLNNYFACIKFDGNIKDATIERLWENLLQTLEVISEAYDDKAINAFFNQGRRHTMA